MPADLASIAAAQAEGYFLVQADRGAAYHPRYLSRLEKPIQCDASGSALRVAPGVDDTSQANADANALAALNGARRHIYGTDATNVNKGSKSGTTLVVGRH